MSESGIKQTSQPPHVRREHRRGLGRTLLWLLLLGIAVVLICRPVAARQTGRPATSGRDTPQLTPSARQSLQAGASGTAWNGFTAAVERQARKRAALEPFHGRADGFRGEYR